jgi:aspartyl-tRNA(Asn)/glutamyl-tRNA(Gln) amidotransferase subunit B
MLTALHWNYDCGGCTRVGTPETDAYETIIGLEVHAQVLTKSKMYCSCSADYANAEPNTHVCPVCLGLPGALPVINRVAIESVIRTGLALNCTIPEYCKLDRKNYVYPDLPKGYQISQYDLPLCINGKIEFPVGDRTVSAGITRVHIEEDTGRLLHEQQNEGDITLVDLNRSGVPLMEIVGEPDLRSPEDAREYLIVLRQILRYIGASTGNMEEGAFRCDANISVRRKDGSFWGPKIEIKNMNSFRAVERALRHEEQRQRRVLDEGGELVQETRGWVEAKGITVSQRTKEQAHDYRYFPEPDLPPLKVPSEQVTTILGTLPELPAIRRNRLIAEYAMSPGDADTLTAERGLADAFEAAVAGATSAEVVRATINWTVNDILGLSRARNLPADTLALDASQIRDLVTLVTSGDLTARSAKDLLPELEPGELPGDVAKRLNLLASGDTDELALAAKSAIEDNPAVVQDYLGGKQAAIGRLIGEVMKRTGGRARPDAVRQALIEQMEG